MEEKTKGRAGMLDGDLNLKVGSQSVTERVLVHPARLVSLKALASEGQETLLEKGST